MNTILKQAVENYIESIDGHIKECKAKPHTGFVAKISTEGDLEYDIFVILPKTKLNYIAELWFGDKNNYDIEDLTKEIANLIVGNGKIVAKEKGIEFNISIPEFLGEYTKQIKYDDILKFKFRNRCFYLLFKEI